MSVLGSSPEPPASILELRRLAQIVEDSEDAIISKDLTGRITSWNRAAEMMFGYAASELIGSSILALFPARLVDEEEMILDRLRRGDRIEHYETVRLHKSGRELDVALTVSPLRDVDGTVIGASKILRDITGDKQLRHRLATLQYELMHVSRQNDMGQMALAFAHELNQPLAALRLHLDTAHRSLDTRNEALVRKSCDRAIQQQERTTQIIDRLRQFIEKRPEEIAIQDLALLMDEAVSLTLLGRSQKNLTVTLQVGENARKALIDRVQVQQVLVNLLRNALEAMADCASPRLTVSTRPAPEGMIEVEVQDSGPGVPAEVLERLFLPFTTTKATGMGVGLSLCRTIVEHQGGEIRGGNASEGGAWFRFTLPAAC